MKSLPRPEKEFVLTETELSAIGRILASVAHAEPTKMEIQEAFDWCEIFESEGICMEL